MEEMGLKVGHTYKVKSIQQHNPCEGDCEPCVVLKLMERGFLVDMEFTVEHILGGNIMISTPTGMFSIRTDHLSTCEFIEINNI